MLLEHVLVNIHLIKYFFFLTKGACDFCFALSGKFCIVVGATIVTTFKLYIFTVYIGQSTKDAGHSVAIFSMIMLIISVIFALIGGSLADKMKQAKGPVILATFLVKYNTRQISVLM